jgi:hypothetical protein
MKLFLEIFLCAEAPGRNVRYTCLQVEITDRRCDPDVVLGEVLAGIGLQADQAGCCAHSTSWRYEPGRTVLTYLVWMGIQDLPAIETHVLAPERVEPPNASGPLRPRPTEIKEEHVLAHGLRHLRFLADHPTNAAAMVGSTFMEKGGTLLRQLEPAVAGRIG